MPGLIGIVQAIPSHDVKSLLETLLVPMRRGGHFGGETLVADDDRWALGRVQLDALRRDPQLTRPEPVMALFHGVLTNRAELQAAVPSAGVPPAGEGDGVASLIVALYQCYGHRLAVRLKGSFVAAVLDQPAKKIVLISDRLGSYPLYWFKRPARFVFASEVKAVVREPTVKPRLNPRAVADYLTFGFLLGDKTLAAEVSLLPPGSTLTYCWEDGQCTLEHYFRLQDFFEPLADDRSRYLDELREAFNASVRRALPRGHQVGLSLSGGLDSRAILSAIDVGQTRVTTHTLGVRGCADEVIAAKLALLAGTEHRFSELDPRALTDGSASLQRIVALADGMYLTHGLTENLALAFLEKSGFSVLLRGHGGELAKASLAWPFHTDERMYALLSTEAFVDYLLGRIDHLRGAGSLRELFHDEWFEQIVGQDRRSLEHSVAGLRLSPPDLCSYVYLAEHHRRFTIASLELFRHAVDVRMPFVDEDFLRVLLGGPARWRDGTQIHRAIIQANHPALLRVRNSNTGAPGDAGPLAEKVLDKVNGLFRRLNLHGYRHYHRFGQWMKDRLLDSVEAVLLHPESRSRGLYREPALKQRLHETRAGVADHAYFLQIALILELWQREHA